MTETPTHDPEIELARQCGALTGEAAGRQAALAFTRITASVTAFARELQRAGLGAEHPEDHCNRCGGPNVVWSAPSPLWNEVMRGGDINNAARFGGIVCPTCFAALAEEAGVGRSWRLDAKWIGVELTTVTPSGRVWNPQTWRWDDTDERTAETTHDPYGTPITPPVNLCDDEAKPRAQGGIMAPPTGPVVINTQPGPDPAGLAKAVAAEIADAHRRGNYRVTGGY